MNDNHQLPPPFSSVLGARLFLFVLAFLLTLPFILDYIGKPTRSQIYKNVDARRSVGAPHHKIIFGKTKDYHSIFVGLSTLWTGVNPAQIEKDLKSKSISGGVALMGANHPGEDLVYISVKDLLEKKKVKYLFVGTPNRVQPEPHPTFSALASPSILDGVWGNLNPKRQMETLSLNILGAPKKMVAGARNACTNKNRSGNLKHNGAFIRDIGWGGKREDFSEYKVEKYPNVTLKGTYFTPKEYDRVNFTNVFNDYQKAFFEKLAKLTKEKNVKMIVISVPIFKDRKSWKPVVRIDRKLMEKLELPILAIPPMRMFNGMSNKDIQRFYYDGNHFNRNGTNYHTKLISKLVYDLEAKNNGKL